MTEFVPQRAENDCLIAVAAMLTNLPYEYAAASMGELGDEPIAIDVFTVFMANVGFCLFQSGHPPIEVKSNGHGRMHYPGAAFELTGKVVTSKQLNQQPGLVVIERFLGGLHALAWDGVNLWDPGEPFQVNPVKWQRYSSIVAFIPVVKWGDIF